MSKPEIHPRTIHALQINLQGMTELAVRCRYIADTLFLSATDMCRAAGRRWADYSKTHQAKEFIAKLAEKLKGDESHPLLSGIGRTAGTWVHEDIAYDIAMWCDVDFRLWCIRQIKALTKGKPIHREIAEAVELYRVFPAEHNGETVESAWAWMDAIVAAGSRSEHRVTVGALTAVVNAVA